MKNDVVNKNMVLLVVLCGILMSVIDGTVVNIALPTITSYFDVAVASSQWVTTAYLITITVMLLVFGKVAEYTGRGKLFTGGVALFTIGSLLCGLSTSLSMLIVFRIVQAIGGAMMFSISSAILFHTFARNEQGKAMGFIGSVVSAGAIIGPVLGGLLIDYIGWKYIFLINVPIGIIQVILCSRYMPLDKPVVTNTAILDLTVFKYKGFVMPLIAMIGMFIAVSMTGIIGPLYYQGVLGYTATFVSVIYLVMSLVSIVGSPIVGRYYDKHENKYLATAGMGLIALGLLIQGYLISISYANVIAYLIVFVIMGVGSCMFQSPNNTEVMRALPDSKINAASSITATTRDLGMTIGSMTAGILIPYLGYNQCTYVAGLICIAGVIISLNRRS